MGTRRTNSAPSSARRRARTAASQPARLRPRWPRHLALLLASVVLTLGALEIGLRIHYGSAGVPTLITYGSTSEEWKRRWIERHRDAGVEVYCGFDRYHPLFGWSIKPNLRAYQAEGLPPVTTNAQGWRALHDYARDRRAGVTRLAVLGDSFTFGEQARDEDVWTVMLEDQLDRAEVLNFGVHGFGTDQQLRVLEEEAITYRPDVVVLGFFVEDILRNGLAFRDYAKPMFVLRDGALVLTNSPVPAPDRILAESPSGRPWSFLAQFIRSRLAAGSARASLDDIVDEQGLLDLTRAILQRMQALTAANGAKLLVTIIPSRRAMPGVEAAIERWAGEIGYAVVNVGPDLDAIEQALGRPAYLNFYHSTLGDLAMAATVRQALVNERWVDPPSDRTLARFNQRVRQAVK